MTLTKDELVALVDYDPETGVFTWRPRNGPEGWNTRFAGKEAGCMKTGRGGRSTRHICIYDQRYIASRLAYLYMTGEWPKEVMDHIDHDATNDRWSNLRAVSQADNSRNASLRKDNKSGVSGVIWNKKLNKWEAYVTSEKRHKHVGLFDEEDLDLAAMEVMEARAELGFHPRHGME